MASLWERALTLLFPHKCFLCGRVLAGEGWLCGECGLPETAGEEAPEAADKAEKPSFFGAIRGIFSPKYDKDGLLILKEKNFFD